MAACPKLQPGKKTEKKAEGDDDGFGTDSAASRIQQARHPDDVPGAARIQRAAVAALHNACGNPSAAIDPLKLNTTPAADFNLCFTDGISREAFKRLQLHHQEFPASEEY